MISEIFDLSVVFDFVIVTVVVYLVDVVIAAAESFVALVAVLQFDDDVLVVVVDQVESVLSNYAAAVSRFAVEVFAGIFDVVAGVDVLEIVVEYAVVIPVDLVENLVDFATVVEQKTQEVSVKTGEEDSVDD